MSCHVPTLEARFSFRNRFLDCIWARLPIACTKGDRFADEVEAKGWGETVPPADPAALAAAMRVVVEQGRAHYAPALRSAAEEYSWDASAQRLEAMAERALPLRMRRPRLRAVGMRMRHSMASRVREA